MLKINESAPLNIKVLDEQNKPISLNSLLGKYVLLYSYPKDDTPGCTTEACNFRDMNSELSKLGVKVIGISKDSVKSHKKFKEKYDLNFPLWSDPDHKLLKALGAWQEKKMFGKSYMGITRSSFAIDPKGKIVKVWPKVDPKKHDQEVLDFFSKLVL